MLSMGNVLHTMLKTAEETISLGRMLSGCLQGRGHVYLYGGLGAGKTTLCRGILRAMGYQGAVKSPTFTLVEPYRFERGQVYHFDLYRLNDSDELEYIGIDDYFSDQNLCLVEWPEKAKDSLPAGDLDVELSIVGKSRCIDFTPNSDFGSEVLEKLKQRLSG
tara:strand:- start:89 stop:574 length:486 start_codon:yes stop_codon:yes gene_type:complete